MNTPWGKADHQKRYGSAPNYVMFYSTPSHGGFLVSFDMGEKMPPGLRAVPTWAGTNAYGKWYEEDCDWAIVALAFPALFEPKQILAAVETANTVWADKGEEAMPVVRAWLRSAEAVGVCEIAARYEIENAHKFRKGCENTGGDGWSVSATNIAGDKSVSLFFPKGENRFYELPSPFTLEDVAQCGGLVVA